jgi:[CysO sulfur-carrier protein]-S-L-cysteine hydrolase
VFTVFTMDLTVNPGILDQILQHAKSAYPNEGCGLVVGQTSAERFIPITNLSASPTEYEMDPAELIRVLRELRGTGDRLVAIYHSHPNGPAELSRKDIERAYYPDAAQVVVSLSDQGHPQTAAFRIIDGAAIPIELHVIV